MNVGRNAATQPSYIVGFDTGPRWQAVARNYEQYSVTGFSVRWIPRPFNDPQVPVQANSIVVFDDINTLDTTNQTEPEIFAKERFHLIDPEKQYRRYCSNRKLAKQS